MSKIETYELCLSQIDGLLADEPDPIAGLANVSAVLKETFDWWWVGFYRVRSNGQEEELVLGPFQGPVACTRIAKGKGVCGTSWAEGRSIVVPDVHQFPGHIACSAASNSEIVVPVRNQKGKVKWVLDADSREFNHFDDTDQLYLEKIADRLRQNWNDEA